MLYCHPPPGIAPETFNPVLTELRATEAAAEGVGECTGENRVNSPSKTGDSDSDRSGGVTLTEFDKQFLKQVRPVC